MWQSDNNKKKKMIQYDSQMPRIWLYLVTLHQTELLYQISSKAVSMSDMMQYIEAHLMQINGQHTRSF